MERPSQQSLNILQNAMETKAKIDAMNEENNRIKEKLARSQETLQRLQNLCIASASLIDQKNIEPSSLKYLSKLSDSTAVVPNKTKDEEDQTKLIIGKYLNQILAVIVDFTEQNSNPNILSMLQLENTLYQLFKFAEEKELVPKRADNEGWKQGMAVHGALAEQILNTLENDEEK
ncbi:hypothetical protein GPJ56_005920 [Histomonas meleagridis]|uniref:uncharacterized protein n=1 Tax=Histomonas meleagridis TaxID=135588 RepID=UPI00355984FD|nr:hypothetical protein GPJ56_005920 [Histomonas meleagridis]KAH0801936.1 hypothetical protein GO595_005354 [Histomonas meleagridis]